MKIAANAVKHLKFRTDRGLNEIYGFAQNPRIVSGDRGLRSAGKELLHEPNVVCIDIRLVRERDVGGLEVKTERGWIAAPPIDGSLVCNIGDMLDRLTGGLYRSTPHRVSNRSGRGRLSMPFFFDPAFDARIVPLPDRAVAPRDLRERWDHANPHDFDGTYGDYLIGKVGKVFPELCRTL